MKKAEEQLESIRKRLDVIASLARARDDEAAHSQQDDLLREVLQEIARPPLRNGGASPRELATAALKVFDINFNRWCG
jgi:hypothetical protein